MQRKLACPQNNHEKLFIKLNLTNVNYLGPNLIYVPWLKKLILPNFSFYIEIDVKFVDKS